MRKRRGGDWVAYEQDGTGFNRIHKHYGDNFDDDYRQETRRASGKVRRTASGYRSYPSSYDTPSRPELKRIFTGLLISFIGLIFLVGLLSSQLGNQIKILVQLLNVLFGWGVYLLVVGMIVAGFRIATRSKSKSSFLRASGYALFFFNALILLEVFLLPQSLDQVLAYAAGGSGGGLIGGILYLELIFQNSIGKAIALFILLNVIAFLLVKAPGILSWLGRAIPEFIKAIIEIWDPGFVKLNRLSERYLGEELDISPSQPEPAYYRKKLPKSYRSQRKKPKIKRRIAPSLPVPEVRYRTAPSDSDQEMEPWDSEAELENDWELPAWEQIFDTAEGSLEEPLTAPEQGESIDADCHLRDLLEGQDQDQLSTSLNFVLGKLDSSEPLILDLSELPHLLIAGNSQAELTACLNTILAGLFFHQNPDQLQLFFLGDQVESFQPFRQLPHFLASLNQGGSRLPGTLTSLDQILKQRLALLEKSKANDFEIYEHRMGAEGNEKLPYLLVVIDDLEDLMASTSQEAEAMIVRLAKTCTQTRMHLIAATQKPDPQVLTWQILASLAARVALALDTPVESELVLGKPGAELLEKNGEILYLDPYAAEPIHLQLAQVSASEIARLIRFWGNTVHEDRFADDEDELDPLLDEAAEIFRSTGRASISMLQRRLRIGYTRATRLMEQLEAEGLIQDPD